MGSGTVFLTIFKTFVMKDSRTGNSRQNKPMMNSHKSRPENKDDIDSRKNEEQETKGDDVTHNKKEVRNDRQRKEKE